MYYKKIMLVFCLILVVLSTSKGLPHSLGQYVDNESFQDALLDHIENLRNVEDEDTDDVDDYNQNNIVLLDVLEALRQHQHKRMVKDYGVYDNDEDDDDSYERDTYTNLISKEYKKELLKALKLKQKKDISHKAHLMHKNTKKELVKKIQQKEKLNTKKELVKKIQKKENLNTKKQLSNKLKEKSKPDLVSQEKREYTNQGNNDEVASVQASDTREKKEKITKKNDNEQVATVTFDDSVAKQEEFVRKIDPKEVFFDPVSDNSSGNGTTTTMKTPQVQHIKQPDKTIVTNKNNKDGLDRVSFIAVIAGCVVAGIAGIALATYCWFKLRRETKELNETTEAKPALSKTLSKKKNGDTLTKKKSLEDDKLAQSAEVFHYLHAKKQMQQMAEPKSSNEKYVSDETSDEEEDDENTVYECPGLAPPGDMKVVNPLFSDTESHHSDHQSDKQSDTPSNEDIEDKNIHRTTPPPENP